MKVSVIIPVYNTAEYLRECVDSILNQSMDDLEVILVDDGSTDQSPQMIQDYCRQEPERVRSIQLDNGGQGRARNHGIAAAQGDFLSFIDSDDYLAPQALELLVAAAEGEQADIAVCDMEKRFTGGRREYVKAALQEAPLASAGSASNKIFRRSMVGDIRFPEGLWYEDFSFSAKLLLKSRKTVFVHEPLYLYRCGQSSTMNNQNARKNLDILEIMQDIQAFSQAGGYQDGYEFLLINHVLLDAIKRVQLQQDPQKKQIIKMLRSHVKERIPSLSDCVSYRRESKNRQLIMRLNYWGMEWLSLLILKGKAFLVNKIST